MSITLENLSKRYGGLIVVDRVSLDVADGELFVLLGTSGSGKSTILRLIAGLIEPDRGKITLHGKDVTSLPPQKRGAGFVFQNYSIFRHMNVADNIEFGLKIRKLPAHERAKKRDELLELVGMAGLGRRFSDQLSGGQLQRVALARALAYQPNVLLLDEPFGALDVKIRSQLRRSLKEVQRKLGVTAILVTHDQDEAYELADRIGVLDRGKLLEVGKPEALYARPETLFAATFLGAGTVLVGKTEGDTARFGSLALPIPAQTAHEHGAPVQMLIRPEQIRISDDEPKEVPVLGRGTIIEQTFTGALRKLRLRLPRLSATRQLSPTIPFGEEGMFVDVVVPTGMPITSDELWVSFTGWHILRQPELRLLIVDQEAPIGKANTLSMARLLVDKMDATATVLSVAGDEDEVETRRAALVASLSNDGLGQPEFRVRTGRKPEQVLAEQNEFLYSMVLLAPRVGKLGDRTNGKHERRVLRRLRRLGPELLEVLENSHTAIMVVKSPRPKVRKILICTALGEPGKNDVLVGGRLARRLNAGVTLLHVTKEDEEPAAFAEAHLDRALAAIRALDVTAEVKTVSARTAAKGILNHSREGDYDLIVIGNHGPQSRSIFGRDDVMLQVLVGSDRPVLVVPADQ